MALARQALNLSTHTFPHPISFLKLPSGPHYVVSLLHTYGHPKPLSTLILPFGHPLGLEVGPPSREESLWPFEWGNSRMLVTQSIVRGKENGKLWAGLLDPTDSSTYGKRQIHIGRSEWNLYSRGPMQRPFLHESKCCTGHRRQMLNKSLPKSRNIQQKTHTQNSLIV